MHPRSMAIEREGFAKTVILVAYNSVSNSEVRHLVLGPTAQSFEHDSHLFHSAVASHVQYLRAVSYFDLCLSNDPRFLWHARSASVVEGHFPYALGSTMRGGERRPRPKNLEWHKTA